MARTSVIKQATAQLSCIATEPQSARSNQPLLLPASPNYCCCQPSRAHLQGFAGTVTQIGQVDAAAVLTDDELGTSLSSRSVRASLHEPLQPACNKQQLGKLM